LIANGILYVNTNQLYAFDATGATNCSTAPTSCTPLWTAPAGNFDGMAIADGVVYVTTSDEIRGRSARGIVGTPISQPSPQLVLGFNS
jgi:hypothetical protein